MRGLVLALLVACTPAQRKATLAISSTALLAADWHQTRTDIVPTCREQNPIIGTCGENVSPDLYFPIVIAANLALGYALGDWGDVWFGATTGAQGATVWSNALRK